MSNSPSKATALVTGASRGIGAGYADRLAKGGYDLILVARSEGPLKRLLRASRASIHHITPIVADLDDKAGLAKVETELKNDPSITMLVNNAGTGSVAPMFDANIEKMEQMIALNITALTRLTYAAAPAFVGRGTGTIINIRSVLAISAATGLAGLIVSALVQQGASQEVARQQIRLFDSQGLVVAGRPGLAANKLPYAHKLPSSNPFNHLDLASEYPQTDALLTAHAQAFLSLCRTAEN
jgi:NADP-dependent 3-hydroxy acid dehydrogenase YdfG